MDIRTFLRLGCGLAICIGLALLVLWRTRGGPPEVLITGLGLTVTSVYVMLLHLGVVDRREGRGDGSGLDLDCGGDGGD